VSTKVMHRTGNVLCAIAAWCSGKAKPCGVSQRSRRVVFSKVTLRKSTAMYGGVMALPCDGTVGSSIVSPRRRGRCNVK